MSQKPFEARDINCIYVHSAVLNDRSMVARVTVCLWKRDKASIMSSFRYPTMAHWQEPMAGNDLFVLRRDDKIVQSDSTIATCQCFEPCHHIALLYPSHHRSDGARVWWWPYQSSTFNFMYALVDRNKRLTRTAVTQIYMCPLLIHMSLILKPASFPKVVWARIMLILRFLFNCIVLCC